MSDPHAILVLICNADGQYLADSGGPGELTRDRTRAAIFDYLRDRVAERIEVANRVHGTAWKPVLADPREGFETCDRCGRRVFAFNAFFDGRQFLCPACRDCARPDQPSPRSGA